MKMKYVKTLATEVFKSLNNLQLDFMDQIKFVESSLEKFCLLAFTLYTEQKNNRDVLRTLSNIYDGVLAINYFCEKLHHISLSAF